MALEWLDMARALDPVLLMQSLGLDPDPWQVLALRSRSERLLLLCGRQTGKSTTTSLIALHRALYSPGSTCLCFAPSLRQSGELFTKISRAYRDLGCPVPARKELALSLELENDSRIIALPGDAGTVRGYSGVSLVIVDEAAMLPSDELFIGVMPMLATTQGRFIALSTPFGRRGFFHDAWTGGDPSWTRITARAADCPRISAEFLAEQRRTLGERWYSQEYECNFVDTLGAVFSQEMIGSMFGDHRVATWGDF